MRIAVDSSWFGPTGIGRVAEEILRRCPKGWDILEIRKGKKNAGVFTPLDLSLELSRHSVDVFWSPGFIPPLIQHKIPVVITVHDLTHLYFYRFYHRWYYDLVIKKILLNVDKIVTVSEFSKRDLLAWSNIDQSKVVKIYNGVSPNFGVHGSVTKLNRPYVLYVGNRRDYKNLAGLMAGFSKSELHRRGVSLALSGESDQFLSDLENKLGLSGCVEYLGFIPEDDLPSIYRGALAFAFVSLYEGFGLPLLEAMACGVPVLTSNVSALPEVAGGAALLVDPCSVSDIADKLNKICFDENIRSNLIDMGFVNLKKFSWDVSAEQYWSIFSGFVK